ncbi:DUF1592 domain-containing protein [Lignipirellula cremea]|uniref:Planctomycete cytochrome C n=1 Tax=Lignipirellula cremea TaxID=2528010 RepID=A0A518DRI3_9BACT|nr:DUF1592 domain-containing protein [Lignipirellula cremea]QDU94424.1 Planctomycete cytochrome C [Lignipirellula cremea]
MGLTPSSRALLLLSTLVCVALAGSVSAAEFEQTLAPFFAKYCNDCHADGAKEGGFNLDTLGADLADPQTMAAWVRVFDRVQQGEMPPADADQPTAAHHAAFIRILGPSLAQAHYAAKGVVLRRLNRSEYENTLNDMFGVNLKLADTLPPDSRSHEFDNVGAALSISMVQMQQYLTAADKVLEAAVQKTLDKPESKVVRASYADTRGVEKFIGNQWHKLDDGAIVFYRQTGYPSGMLREANTRTAGRYKIRVTGYAYQSDQPITFSVGSTTFARGVETPTYGYYSMPPGKPTTIELEAWIENNYMVEVTPWDLHDEKNEIKEKGIANYTGPGLAINHIELEGPLVDEFPTRGHHLLFDGLKRQEIMPRNPADRQRSWYQPKFEIISENPQADAHRVLKRVASKAFRRPATEADLAPYLELFSEEMKAGATLEEGLLTSVAAVLCSPKFLFLQEPAGWLDDYAVASRLSYFLTRTSPDDELLATAQSGQLIKDRTLLRKQTERLLQSEHAQRFVNDFTDAWLNLRDLEFTNPDDALFPEYDRFLLFSMQEETRSFFHELLAENLPVRNVAASDFAMLNNRLARHYEIDGVVGPHMRRVKLPADSVRGGLLSQASVLKVSANGTNTSPVVRGVWVMERLLGETPQPPPPGIAGVEPDIRGATTLRELLDKHRNLDSCRACHQAIDPPGFALESFDPIGGWRDRFRSLGDGEKVDLVVNARKVRYKLGQPVDATGQLADGRKFDGFRQFRTYLASDEDRLAKALTEKLLTFATGRELGFSDRAEVERIVQQSAADGHGVRNLLFLCVESEIFRRK